MFNGKAGSLKFLASLGLNVPPFTVITHEEFISWGDKKIWDELHEALATTDAKKIENLAKSFIHSVHIPDTRLDLGKNVHYAVRSSASLEDSPEHSFAGIFETKLFISQKLNEAIKEVWHSLFHTKALQYCVDRRLSWTLLKMDIVVQAMIDGEKSGVLFQADPLGKITEQIIVAGPGLGQGIVDEETDTDRYIVENYIVKERHIHNKKHYIAFDQGSNTLIKKELADNQRELSTLSDSDIEKLLKASSILSSKVEHFLDIEFTFRNGDLFVLQARPITTVPSRKHIHIFDNSNIAENYPKQSTPLTYTALARGYSANFKNLVRYLGFSEDDFRYINHSLENLVGQWGGQIYYNLNNWYSVYTLLPFGGEKAASSFEEMVGIGTSGMIEVPERTLFQKLRIIAKILPKFASFYFMAGRHHRQYKKEFKELYERFNRDAHNTKDAFETIHLLSRLDSEFLAIIKIPLLNDFFSSVLNRSCRILAGRLAGSRGDQLYNDLLSHREDLESSKAIYSLIGLAESVRANHALVTFLEKNLQDHHILARLLEHSEFRDFYHKFKAHLDRFGDRSQWEMKIEVPTARENPETTIKLILEYAKSGMSEKSQRSREREKSDYAHKELKKYWFAKPLTSLLFWQLFRKCTEVICFREDARFDRVRFKGLSRKLVLSIGKNLVAKKWIEQTEDIFYLTYDELMSLVYDTYGPGYWRELISLRKNHLEKFKDLKLPDRLIVNDLTFAEKLSDKSTVTSSNSVRGVPCSGGIIETQCEVVLDLNQAPSLNGKILVAERTDPAWGYFFVGVKGIIIEKGSMLSHAAIISRELGIPCIINVKNATERFKSGMKIRMNGDTGEIEIL
ncbi:PEP/pyruvate-binding domain-containing protein [Peredibacter starrii]|uniref:PEP/pyruvate-binding domain-containing protein n=1 Tax=Peredibacter starrii TaxID=28202 RepID=A0AAX4HRF3_9BACT|nr:PEP/pyruvate-binding domain-containing protein [Peredibacter starrii]WPU65688.1 PEP/pyruvate-binding domain-containing protein [Peredibacter starrii]